MIPIRTLSIAIIFLLTSAAGQASAADGLLRDPVPDWVSKTLVAVASDAIPSEDGLRVLWFDVNPESRRHAITLASELTV